MHNFKRQLYYIKPTTNNFSEKDYQNLYKDLVDHLDILESDSSPMRITNFRTKSINPQPRYKYGIDISQYKEASFFSSDTTRRKRRLPKTRAKKNRTITQNELMPPLVISNNFRKSPKKEFPSNEKNLLKIKGRSCTPSVTSRTTPAPSSAFPTAGSFESDSRNLREIVLKKHKKTVFATVDMQFLPRYYKLSQNNYI